MDTIKQNDKDKRLIVLYDLIDTYYKKYGRFYPKEINEHLESIIDIISQYKVSECNNEPIFRKISYLELLQLMDGGYYPYKIKVNICHQDGYYYWDMENECYLLDKSDERNDGINKTNFNLYLRDSLTDGNCLEKIITVIDTSNKI